MQNMLNVLSQPVDIERIKASFQRWLVRLVPRLTRWLPQWLLEDEIVFELEPAGSNLAIEVFVNGKPVQRKHLEASKLKAAWPELFSGRLSATRGDRTTRLVLPVDNYLIKQIDLPESVASRPAEFAELQIDLETPFNRQDVYFSAVVSDPTDAGQSRMELAVSPRRLVDPLLSALKDIGIHIDAVTVHSAKTPGKRHNLLPAPQQVLISRKSAIALSLAAVFGLQLFLIIALPLYFRAETAAALETRSAELVSKAGKISEGFAKSLDRLSHTRHAIDEKQSRRSLLSTLKSLTSAIPDDSYLDRLRYERDQVEIAGLTPSTTALIDRLSQQSGFSSPAYISPVVRDQQSKLERFDLSFKLTSGMRR